MKKLILILLLMLMLFLLAWAGTEEHDPLGDVSVQWAYWNCAVSHANCVNDNDDGTGVYVDDDSEEGYWEKYTWDNTAISDSTIDSVVYAVRCSVTNGSNSIAILDSLSGNAIRQSSTIALATGAWQDKTIKYTTSPAGAAWTWTNIDDIIAGFIAINVVNKQYIYVCEAWFTVYYEPVEEGGKAQVIMIRGD